MAIYRCSQNPDHPKTINVPVKAGGRPSITLDCRQQDSKSNAPSSVPEAKPQNAPRDPNVDNAIEVIRTNVGADAAQTLKSWYELRMEPPAVVFATFLDVTQYASGERRLAAEKMAHLFATQLEIDLSKARMGGKNDEIRAITAILHPQPDWGDVARTLDWLGDFNQRNTSDADRGWRNTLMKAIPPMVEAQARAGQWTTQVEATTSQAASDKFIGLLHQVEKIGPDAAQTLQIWWDLKREPPALVFDTNPDVSKLANDEREQVAVKIAGVFGTEMVMDLSMAKMKGRDDAIEAFKAIIGAKSLTVIPRSAGGMAIGRPFEETVEKAVQDLGDFNQGVVDAFGTVNYPDSMGANLALRQKMCEAICPLMNGK